jgi:hypothetical protein
MLGYNVTQKHKMVLSRDRAVTSLLADGYNVYYGARSIKHEVSIGLYMVTMSRRSTRWC